MSHYYSNGTLAQYELALTRKEAIAWGADILVKTEEEHYEQFIYLFDVTIEIGANEEQIIAVRPIFCDD